MEEVVGTHLSLIIPEFRTNLLNFYVSEHLDEELDMKGVSDIKKIYGTKKNGEEFIAEATITKVILNHGPVITLFIRDITQRASLERELLSSKYRFETLIRMTDEAIITLDRNLKVVIFNEGAKKVFGYTESEIIGKHINELIPFEHRKNHDQHIVDFGMLPNTSKVMSLDNDVFGLRKDGIEFHAEATITNIQYENEMMYSIILRDVSSRKLMETQMRQYLTDLEKVNVEKEKYFTLLAHDLRSPFGNLLGFIDYMQDNIDEIGKEELQDILRSCAASAKNIYQLLESLLDWTRLQMNRISFSPTIVSPQEQIKYALNLYKEAIENKNIRVNINLPDGLEVIADPDMFSTIARNLISNAIKFSYENGEIDINHSIEENVVSLHFVDYGIGMEEETLSKLFRTDKETHSEGTSGETGFGLGLLLVKDFVELNNGFMNVNSSYKHGTTISINLPSVNVIR